MSALEAALIAAAAGVLLTLAGALWFRHALAAARTDGERRARVEAELSARRRSGEAAAAAAAGLAVSEADVAALEAAGERRQETIDDLARTTGRAAPAGGAVLDADLVRAVDAVGREPRSPRQGA